MWKRRSYCYATGGESDYMAALIKKEKYRYSKNEKQIILQLVERVLKEEQREGEVSILLTHDQRMKELNERYRQISSPTDVLSFPQNLPELLGDIAISTEMAERRAIEEESSLIEVILILILHGLLHLLGYDHKEEKEGQIMEEKEELYRRAFFPDTKDES